MVDIYNKTSYHAVDSLYTWHAIGIPFKSSISYRFRVIYKKIWLLVYRRPWQKNKFHSKGQPEHSNGVLLMLFVCSNSWWIRCDFNPINLLESTLGELQTGNDVTNRRNTIVFRKSSELAYIPTIINLLNLIYDFSSMPNGEERNFDARGLWGMNRRQPRFSLIVFRLNFVSIAVPVQKLFKVCDLSGILASWGKKRFDINHRPLKALTVHVTRRLMCWLWKLAEWGVETRNKPEQVES